MNRSVFFLLMLCLASLTAGLPVEMVGEATAAEDGVAAEDRDAAPNPDAADAWEQDSLPMFDGKTLLGWEGNAQWFRVEDGAIVAGRLDRKIPHNEFLCTVQKYDDFELRWEAKLVGEGKNAGVQFRSKRVKDSTEVSGYQADIGEAFNGLVWGALYDESRRRKMLAQPDQALIQRIVKPNDWNAMRLVCQGPHIQIFVNGVKTVDYVEPDDQIPRHGIIGLQIHSGPPSEAWYRNVRIRQIRSR